MFLPCKNSTVQQHNLTVSQINCIVLNFCEYKNINKKQRTEIASCFLCPFSIQKLPRVAPWKSLSNY